MKHLSSVISVVFSSVTNLHFSFFYSVNYNKLQFRFVRYLERKPTMYILINLFRHCAAKIFQTDFGCGNMDLICLYL